MKLSGVPRAQLLRGVTAVIALAIAGAMLAGGAFAHGRVHRCLPVISAKYQSRNRVTAAGTSCRAARKLVLAWTKDATTGRIPDRIIAGKVNKKNVVVFDRWGPRYHWHGWVCRWMGLKPDHGTQPGRGRCRAGTKQVEWTYHYAENPTVGNVRGCGGGLGFHDGAVTGIRASHLTCRKGRHLVHAAIRDRVIGPEHHQLGVLRRHALGFTWGVTGTGDFRARHGRARLTFHLCWYNVDC